MQESGKESFNCDTHDFEFMLKEYEMQYGHFERHYEAVEKSFRLFLVIVGAISSFVGLIYQDQELSKFELFDLEVLPLVLFTLTSIFGLLIFLRIIEHRLLIIEYVKALNLNRRWFADHSPNKDVLVKYMYWKPQIARPHFFSWFNHFFGEAASMAFIVGSFSSVSGLNIWIKLFGVESDSSGFFSSLVFLVLTLLITFLLMLIYKLRANIRQNNLKKLQAEEFTSY